MMTEPQSKIVVTPRQLDALLRAGQPATLLDVRTPGEFAAAHVPGATLIPLDELDCAAFLAERGASDDPIYVLCQSGGRARRAIEQFQRAGYHGCVLVEGGTQAWLDAGLPVNRGASRVISLERQVRIVAGALVLLGVTLGWLVHAGFFGLSAFVGAGLVFAGITDFCGMGLLLARMPWNKSTGCASTSCCSG